MDNQQRAAWGKKAVTKGNPDHKDSMSMDEHGLETSASDSLANILHHVQQEGGDTAMVLRMALGNFNAEAGAKLDIQPPPTLSENQRLASILKKWFPWLATDEELKSCSDQVDTLNELYRALLDDDGVTPIDPTLDELIQRYGDLSLAYGELEEGSSESESYYNQVNDARNALVNFVNSAKAGSTQTPTKQAQRSSKRRRS